jgi:hypothetical protein
MPRRMSVAPVASQTRTPDGGKIIGATLALELPPIMEWPAPLPLLTSD